ncbi:tetratricopeptide repeat protein [Alterisphingorhabdus coralli]|uniref:Tetratricopeptide repeat protein n=1 Tax=Alterisphingorhabdus coralli TaxID=3071408 RepID=A0AA97I2R1_9SPHN|nr:tetratricopeptide repeat protein [Parasphingorhabdus sp. SCSIO 66989]WOE76518.1 tetratricopeptide repeat protein [Parasphingorhabdus sp. SCSIO 66989]
MPRLSRFNAACKRHWRAAMLSIAIGTMLSIGPVAGQSDAARDAAARAEQSIGKGDYRAARIEMLNAISEAPDWAEARLLQAEIYLRLRDPLAAEAELRRAREFGTPDEQLRHLMGHALQLQGQLDRARKWLTEGPVARKHLAYAQRILAEVYLADGDRDRARAAYDAAIAADGSDPMLWVSIARYRYLDGDQKGAIDAADFAVQLAPQSIDALLYRGELARSQFGLIPALPWFERALEINPDHIPTLIAYGETLGDAGRMTDMLAVARKIIALEPGNDRGLFLQAVLAARARQFDLARSIMLKTQNRLDDQAAPALLRCALELEVDNLAQAEEHCATVLRRQPHNLFAGNLAMRGMAGGSDREMFFALVAEHGLLTTPNSFRLLLAARAYEADGNRPMAADFINRASRAPHRPYILVPEPSGLSELEAAIQASPGDAGAEVRLIRKLLTLDRYVEALRRAKSLQRRFPGVADAHLLVGDVHMLSNRPEEGFSAYQEAGKLRFTFDVMVRLHDALADLGRDEDKAATLRSFLANNPAHLRAKHMLGTAYLDAERWELARVTLSEVSARLGGNVPLLLADLAWAELNAGAPEKAQRTAAQAYRTLPMNPVVTYVYGQVLAEDDTRLRDAIDLFEKAVQLAPQDQRFRASLRDAKRRYAALDKA